MMQKIEFDHNIDMTDSSVFSQGFWDDEKKMLYLIFNNGVRVTRHIPGWSTETVREVDSWGSIWNRVFRLQDPPSGVYFEEGVQFVQRPAPSESPLDEESPAAESGDEEALINFSIDFDAERLTKAFDAGAELIEALSDTLSHLAADVYHLSAQIRGDQ